MSVFKLPYNSSHSLFYSIEWLSNTAQRLPSCAPITTPGFRALKPWAEHQQFPPILPALSHKADSDHIKSTLPTPKIPRTSPVIYLFLNLPLRCSYPTLSSPAHQALGFALGMPWKPGYQPEHGVKSYYTKLVFCVGFISGMWLFQVHWVAGLESHSQNPFQWLLHTAPLEEPCLV